MDELNEFIRKHRITEKKIFICLLLVTFIIISSIFAIRLANNQPPIIGREAYNHLLIASEIFNGKSVDLATPLQEKVYHYNPFHLLLASLMLILKDKLIAIILPLALGLLSVYLLHLLLKDFSVKKEHSLIIMLVFILSNGFIYAFSTISQESFAFLLTLLGIYLYYKNNVLSKIFAVIVFLAICSLSSFNSIVLLVALIFLEKLKKPDRKLLLISLIMIIIASFLLRMPLSFYFNDMSKPIFTHLISDFGGLNGFSMFSLLLAAIGFFISWQSRKKIQPLYIIFLLLLPFVFYLDPSTTIYLNLVISLAVGITIHEIIRRKWAVEIIKDLTFLLLICGFLFSVVSTVKQISDMPPSSAEVMSLEILGATKAKSGIVFSGMENSFWIEGMSKAKVMLDPLMQKESAFKELSLDYNKIIHSTNLMELRPLLDKHKVRYFWINPSMKEEIWNGEKKELLFLFKSNETFKNVYNTNGIEIWEYVGAYYDIPKRI